MIKILVVEDDPPLNTAICRHLTISGYETAMALSANDAYDKMYNSLFDIIISDIMMPGINGFEFAETVRGLNRTIPILFMSALDDFGAKQRGFRLGIDDYMTKPINNDELVLRIEALLRRANINAEKKLDIGNFTLNANSYSAEIGGMGIAVTLREFNILYKLLSYPNMTFSRQQLMDEFWDANNETTLRAVDIYISKLRNKLSECDGFKLITVRGIGYKAVTQ